MRFLIIKTLLLTGLAFIAQDYYCAAQQPSGVRKLKDVVIYSDPDYYAAFPSVVRRRSGEIIVAFRRAPARTIFMEENYTHTDANSYLVLVRSSDGETWTKEPELIYAHPFGGSQDPCLIQLRDKTLLCTSYGWSFVRPEGIAKMKKPVSAAGDFVFLGGYILRSTDGGKKWEGPLYPLSIEPEVHFNAVGVPVPAYNRGALFESETGRIYWVVAAGHSESQSITSTHLICSDDKGTTWKYLSQVAKDETASFNESSVYETPRGDLVVFMRTANLDDQACIARSTDGGKSFGPWEKMGFQGHPLNALRLPDKRVLLTYGYRHKPYGIRARILNPECTDFASAPEIIIRDDGGNGYRLHMAGVADKNMHCDILFQYDNGTAHHGTILEICVIKQVGNTAD